MEPALMRSLCGEPIADRQAWEAYRKEEIVHLFEHYVYGERPVERPDDLAFRVETVSRDFHGLIYKKVEVSFGGYSFPVKAFLPRADHPVPAFVYVMHEHEENRSDLDKEPNCPYVPVLDITDRGYGVFVVYLSTIYPDCDHKANYEAGIFTVLSPDRAKRKPSDWASISAWAWAASRVMDYIETDPAVDESQVAVAGHSRGGKTALWCGATDPRFSFVVSNCSGCSGAAMLRGKTGEHLDYITTVTDWFCANYSKYVENEEMLPVDQHMLLALIAPRALYVGSKTLDDWADPRSERRACVLAGEAYALYGKQGVVLPGIEYGDIQPDTPYHEGMIGYHAVSGDHGICPSDWKLFMDFWDQKRKA